MRERPDFSRRREIADGMGIHWKTGTSYGHLDAWAAGSGAEQTAVVWMGNHDRTPSTGLVGAQRSGPVLFDVLEALETDRTDDERTDDLVEVEVCAYSGHLPLEACEHRKTAWALEKSVPVKRCPYHVEVDIDIETGRSLAPVCRIGRAYRTESRLVWPAGVRRHLAARYRYSTRIPRLMDGCVPTEAATPPRIVSPPSGQALVLIPGMTADQQEVPLQAETSHGGQTISWFVNGEFLAAAQSHERVWWTPSPGNHELVAMDDSGRASRREVTVRSR
jgi:penicillin-binding protein 1C